MDTKNIMLRIFKAIANHDIEELHKIKEELNQAKENNETFDYSQIDESISIGDEVTMKEEFQLVYLIDVETNEQLSNNFQKIPDNIIKLYMSKPMIVIQTGLSKEYMCGHCSNPHYHDISVFIPSVNREYYTSSRDVCLISK